MSPVISKQISWHYKRPPSFHLNKLVIGENMVKVVLKVRKKGVLILPKPLREIADIGEVSAEV